MVYSSFQWFQSHWSFTQFTICYRDSIQLITLASNWRPNHLGNQINCSETSTFIFLPVQPKIAKTVQRAFFKSSWQYFSSFLTFTLHPLFTITHPNSSSLRFNYHFIISFYRDIAWILVHCPSFLIHILIWICYSTLKVNIIWYKII